MVNNFFFFQYKNIFRQINKENGKIPLKVMSFYFFKTFIITYIKQHKMAEGFGRTNYIEEDNFFLFVIKGLFFI